MFEIGAVIRDPASFVGDQDGDDRGGNVGAMPLAGVEAHCGDFFAGGLCRRRRIELASLCGGRFWRMAFCAAEAPKPHRRSWWHLQVRG